MTWRGESAVGYAICLGQVRGKRALPNTYCIEMPTLQMIFFQKKRWYGSLQPLPDGLADIMIGLSTKTSKRRISDI